MKYDVFISCKSEDYHYAQPIYEYLTANGLKVFLADVELRKKGRDVYGEIIDLALESADHLVLFASRASYVTSTYVKSEWRTFVEEKRSGRKSGNIITILKNVKVAELPIALRSFQSFPYSDYKSVLDYLSVGDGVGGIGELPPPTPRYRWWLLGVVMVLIILGIGIVSIIKDNKEDFEQTPEKRELKTEIQATKGESVQLQPDKTNVDAHLASAKNKTQVEVKVDANKTYEIAIKKKDYNTLRKLADDGYSKAYIPLAKHYLKQSSTHNLADKYAQKAHKVGIKEAEEIINTLTLYGYYD